MLDYVILGNSAQSWIIALCILLGAFIIGRVVSRLIKAVGLRFQSQFVSLLAGGLSGPITALFVVVGTRVAAESLIFSSGAQNLIQKSIVFSIVVVITWAIVNCYDSAHKGLFEPYAKRADTNIDFHLLSILRTTLYTLIWTVGLASALNTVGFEVSAILAGLGIGGMAIALASQDTVANIFGGVLILLQRPFKIGERIEVAGVNGWVTQIGLRNTLIKNWYGQSVLIPNKKFTESIVVNIDAQQVYYQEVRLHLDVNTTATQVEVAMQILKGIVTKVENLNPTPWVMLNKFGSGFLEIEFWYGINRWNPKEDKNIPNEYEKICLAKTAVNLEIMRGFEQAGVRLALPIVVHVPGNPKDYAATNN
ncbi:MAG: mechanosensitive ion channel family protein [Gallionella sp.]